MKLLALLLFGICLPPQLSAEDKAQPPVLITKVEPDYESSTAYLIDVAELELTLDDRGVPFALKSSVGLPDNVVRALSQWRYRPYKKSGHAVPCALKMNFTFRRPITPVVEHAIRPSWAPTDEKVRQAVERGNHLTAQDASKLEEDLPRAEALEHTRTSLLIYYSKGLPDVSKAREARARIITWLIQNYPDDEILGSPAGIINSTGEPLADAEAQNQAKQLWLEVLGGSAKNSTVAEHAVNFLQVADSAKALQILAGLRTWSKSYAWMGKVYALEALGVTALDPDSGEAVAASHADLTQSAQAKLLKAADATAVLSGMATVASSHFSLAKAQRWTPEQQEFCQELLRHARQIYPATSVSCDAPERDSNRPVVHLDQRMIQAQLRKKVQPIYPAEAKQQRIQGTIEFSAVIGESGRIEQLALLSGPLALYVPSQQAVSQWEFNPTKINGEPVAVATRITVNFTVSH